MEMKTHVLAGLMTIVLLLIPLLILTTRFSVTGRVAQENIALLSPFKIEGIALESFDPTICGISFTMPWYEVRLSDGTYLMIIDYSGNLYVNSSSFITGINPPDTDWINSFLVKNGTDVLWAFNKSRAIVYGNVIENSNPSYDSGDLIIKNSTSTLAVFDGSTGNIYIRGKAVYQGSQAGCPSDGCANYGDYSGCGDDPTAEDRDYYCDASYGVCTYFIKSTLDCDSYDNCAPYCNTTTGDIVIMDYYAASDCQCVSNLLTIEDCQDTCSDTDGGLVYVIRGTVTDTNLCSTGQTSCPSFTYTDYCSDLYTLVEYYCSGTNYASSRIDCFTLALEDCCFRYGSQYACGGTCENGLCSYWCSWLYDPNCQPCIVPV